jgi:predicted RND superfamily exporter protein
MVAFGFFVLVGGNLVPIRRAGWIIGVLMLLSAFIALVYLPAVLMQLKGFLEKKSEGRRIRRSV